MQTLAQDLGVQGFAAGFSGMFSVLGASDMRAVSDELCHCRIDPVESDPQQDALNPIGSPQGTRWSPLRV